MTHYLKSNKFQNIQQNIGENERKMKQELLAPAGDINAGYAALYYGADAVYLGLQQFSARATAVNFSDENLDEFVGFAHSLGRKVYVTINTLVQEKELSDLLKTLDVCSKYKVDAIILQDLGVAGIIRKYYPELELHASTQMAVHNKEGALALQKIGFSRVVLARELTLPEITEIAQIPNLETEAFIHGALCYSYSGLCLFSSVLTGKSANRGKCLYPCRSCFHGEDGEKHYFSMKDMSLQRDVLKMPVTSLKIEGRKKSDLYVAAVTDYYRRILDGKGADAFREDNIKQIFSRPWTKFHFNGKNKDIIDRDFVGHRGLEIGLALPADGKILKFKSNHVLERHDGIQIDAEGWEKPFGFALLKMKVNGKDVFEVHAGEVVEIKMPPHAPNIEPGTKIYLASSSSVKATYKYEKPKQGQYKQRRNIKVEVEINSDYLTAKSNGFEYVLKGVFEPASNVLKTTEALEKAFTKTGDTSFELEKLCIANPKGLFVPASLANELRRGLYAQMIFEDKKVKLPEIVEHKRKEKSEWLIKTDDLSCLNEIDISDVSEIIYLLDKNSQSSDVEGFPKDKIRLALPTVCRKTKEFEAVVGNFVQAGYKKWEVGNYWGIEALSAFDVHLSFDSSIYMMNTQAVLQAKDMNAERMTLSLEDTLENLAEITEKSSLPVVMCLYTDAPLFTSAGCIRSNPCQMCDAKEKWIELSKDGEKYSALSKNCQTMLFADKALCFASDAKNVHADYYRVDFVYKKYTAKQAKEIWEKVHNFEDVENTQKANLQRRKIMF